MALLNRAVKTLQEHRTKTSRRTLADTPGPVRTCVGCRHAAAKSDSVRLVLAPDGTLVADVAGKAFGRGAWVHATEACILAATRGGLSRSFKAAVTASVPQIGAAIGTAAERKLEGLIVAARNARMLAVGADATHGAVNGGEASLVIVARDAGSIATREWVTACVTAGKALAWGDKASLGALLGRGDTAMLGVLNDKFSRAMREAGSLVEFARMVRSSAGNPHAHDATVEERSAEAPASLEVR